MSKNILLNAQDLNKSTMNTTFFFENSKKVNICKQL